MEKKAVFEKTLKIVLTKYPKHCIIIQVADEQHRERLKLQPSGALEKRTSKKFLTKCSKRCKM